MLDKRPLNARQLHALARMELHATLADDGFRFENATQGSWVKHGELGGSLHVHLLPSRHNYVGRPGYRFTIELVHESRDGIRMSAGRLWMFLDRAERRSVIGVLNGIISRNTAEVQGEPEVVKSGINVFGGEPLSDQVVDQSDVWFLCNNPEDAIECLRMAARSLPQAIRRFRDLHERSGGR